MNDYSAFPMRKNTQNFVRPIELYAKLAQTSQYFPCGELLDVVRIVILITVIIIIIIRKHFSRTKTRPK